MEKITENDLKHYHRQIKLLFPIFKRQERRFLKDLEISINSYVIDNPQCSLSDIENHFGTPAEIVSGYIEDYDASEMNKRLVTSKLIKRCIVVTMTVMIIACFIWGLLAYSDYKQSAKEYIDREVVVIEEN